MGAGVRHGALPNVGFALVRVEVKVMVGVRHGALPNVGFALVKVKVGVGGWGQAQCTALRWLRLG